MSNQNEFPGMPEMEEIGKQARKYLDILGNMKTLKDRLDTERVELIKLFKKENKLSITVDGISLSYTHLEKDQIKVKQPEYQNL